MKRLALLSSLVLVGFASVGESDEKTHAPCQFPIPTTSNPKTSHSHRVCWRLGVGSWEFIGMGSHRRRVVTDIRPCSSVRRSDLQTPLRRVSRATCRWQNPRRDTLQNMPSSRILRTLDFGAMMTIAYQLNRDEREAVARFLGKPGGDPPPRARGVLPRSFGFDRHECVTSLERLESFAQQLALCACRARQAHARAGVEAEAEVGLWIRGRYLRLRAAHGDWQPGLHRQRGRRGARAARGHRLSAVDVSGCGIDSLRDGGRAAGRPERACSSAISLAGSTRSTPRQEKRSGASDPRNTKPFV